MFIWLHRDDVRPIITREYPCIYITLVAMVTSFAFVYVRVLEMTKVPLINVVLL
jgi:hypothetical protein